MAATVDQFARAAGDGNVAEMRRCSDAGVDKDGYHSSYVSNENYLFVCS
jgi:hypothetical protein